MGSNTFPVPVPRLALFDQSHTFQWTGSPAVNFNGFCLIGLVLPSDGVATWAQADYGNLSPSLRLPIWQRIPIVDGQLNGGCGLFLNTDIVPPDSAYVAYYYDTTGRQLAGPTSTFTVLTQDKVTPPILPLTAPSTLGPLPVPD
jgi:hypothetical protein